MPIKPSDNTMSDFVLTPDERALIEERRQEATKRELAAIEAAKLPDISQMPASEVIKLPAETRAKIMRQCLEVVAKAE